MLPTEDPHTDFARLSDAELLYLAQHARRYPPELGHGALQELQRRGLVPAELPQERPAPEADRQPARPEPSWWAQASRVFRPGGSYFITPLLLWLNLAVFGWMVAQGTNVLHPAGPDLIRWGSNFSPLTLHGQWWRLFTACFLHGGLTHLLLNSYALVFIGVLAEPLVGRWRLLLVYLLSGVAGNMLSLWWHTGGVNGVGASGAIFGLYGLLLALVATGARHLTRPQRLALLVNTLLVTATSLTYGLQQPSVDNAAHLGGLLLGLVAGVVLGIWSRLFPAQPAI
jgi:rhomboid protease GluP